MTQTGFADPVSPELHSAWQVRYAIQWLWVERREGRATPELEARVIDLVYDFAIDALDGVQEWFFNPRHPDLRSLGVRA